ncbi:MAG: hypothetical protein GF350_16050, partial [Chitinivibrionales bacterium]|nr:hypothetical protein [Chitinivibrionales bacterium]
MKVKQTGIFYAGNSAAAAAKPAHFPRELQRKLLAGLDSRFLLFLVGTGVV